MLLSVSWVEHEYRMGTWPGELGRGERFGGHGGGGGGGEMTGGGEVRWESAGGKTPGGGEPPRPMETTYNIGDTH